MTDIEQFIAELQVMANRAVELDANIATSLFVTLGAYKDGQGREFAKLCRHFAQERKAILEREAA